MNPRAEYASAKDMMRDYKKELKLRGEPFITRVATKVLGRMGLFRLQENAKLLQKMKERIVSDLEHQVPDDPETGEDLELHPVRRPNPETGKKESTKQPLLSLTPQEVFDGAETLRKCGETYIKQSQAKVTAYWENPATPDADANKLKSLCANIRVYQTCFKFHRPSRLD
jgi:hypothetical protein